MYSYNRTEIIKAAHEQGKPYMKIVIRNRAVYCIRQGILISLLYSGEHRCKYINTKGMTIKDCGELGKKGWKLENRLDESNEFALFVKVSRKQWCKLGA